MHSPNERRQEIRIRQQLNAAFAFSAQLKDSIQRPLSRLGWHLWIMFMEAMKYKTALIVGAGEGLSASLARLFTRQGIRVALAARQTNKLAALCKETGATAYACDATSLDDVTRLFASVEHDCGAPDV